MEKKLKSKASFSIARIIQQTQLALFHPNQICKASSYKADDGSQYCWVPNCYEIKKIKNNKKCSTREHNLLHAGQLNAGLWKSSTGRRISKTISPSACILNSACMPFSVENNHPIFFQKVNKVFIQVLFSFLSWINPPLDNI